MGCIGIVWCGGLHYNVGIVGLVLGPACSYTGSRRDGVHRVVWQDGFLFLLVMKIMKDWCLGEDL